MVASDTTTYASVTAPSATDITSVGTVTSVSISGGTVAPSTSTSSSDAFYESTIFIVAAAGGVALLLGIAGIVGIIRTTTTCCKHKEPAHKSEDVDEANPTQIPNQHPQNSCDAPFVVSDCMTLGVHRTHELQQPQSQSNAHPGAAEQDGITVVIDDDALLEQMRAASNAASQAMINEHLQEYRARNPDASYVSWIASLHPENVTIDHRMRIPGNNWLEVLISSA